MRKDPDAKAGSAVVSGYAPAALILSRKAIPSNNVVVGTDPVQVRFLEQQLGIPATVVERVTDSLLAASKNCLYHVYAAHRVDLSPEMLGRTGMWSADPIGKGSATLHALVKLAISIVYPNSKGPDKLTIAQVEKLLDRQKIEDLRGLIWEAVWLLLGPVETPRRWLEPWESATKWLDPDDDVEKRLHVLYRQLIRYSIFVTRDEDAAKAAGLEPRDLQKYKDLSLDLNKVYQTILLLSSWRQMHTNPYICALRISVVWL
jgi:hypothetical protein